MARLVAFHYLVQLSKHISKLQRSQATSRKVDLSVTDSQRCSVPLSNKWSFPKLNKYMNYFLKEMCHLYNEKHMTCKTVSTAFSLFSLQVFYVVSNLKSFKKHQIIDDPKNLIKAFNFYQSDHTNYLVLKWNSYNGNTTSFICTN